MRLQALATLIFVTSASPAIADSCLPFLHSKGGPNVLVMSTLNKNAVASFAYLYMLHQDAITGPPIFRPERFTTFPANQPQVFSDRTQGAQRFSFSKADQITLTMTVAATPQVTLVLRTWGNVSQTFPVTCTPSGGMYGPPGDVSYLFRFLFSDPIR